MAPRSEALRRLALTTASRLLVRPSRFAAFGPDSLIVPPATVLAPGRITIGARVLILGHVTLSVVEEHWGERYDPRLRIGDGTVVGPRAWLGCVSSIELGAEVLIGPGALLSDALHGVGAAGVPILRAPMVGAGPLRVGDGAMVGAGASMLAGASLGPGACLLPGAVLHGAVPARAVAAGNPAEVIRRWEDGRWQDSDDPRWAALLARLPIPAAGPGSAA